MPRRRRWSPVRGTGNRVYAPTERLALALADLPGRLGFALARGVGLVRAVPAPDPAALREVLVLRLDRIGDVAMSLAALAELRAALPAARIRLAVGRWSEQIARSAPVDELLVWSAPWVGRPDEGSESLAALAARARALRPARLDLALDLQGDVRANLLLWLSGARHRVGYANTGGRQLLTRAVPLDESVSWVEQNRLAVAVALGRLPAGAAALAASGGASAPRADAPRVALVADPERDFARRLLDSLGLAGRRPRVAIHPSGGRRVKQWPVARWRAVAEWLQREHAAAVFVTGSAADAPLAAAVSRGLPERTFDMTGRLSVRETLALVAELDLFLSPDTGPMHLACAVATPTVSVFGPSDPVRYFSGDTLGTSDAWVTGAADPGAEPPAAGRVVWPPAPSCALRHVVVRPRLWCSPCNRIRKPPGACAGETPPECLELVSVEAVCAAAAALLPPPDRSRGRQRPG